MTLSLTAPLTQAAHDAQGYSHAMNEVHGAFMAITCHSPRQRMESTTCTKCMALSLHLSFTQAAHLVQGIYDMNEVGKLLNAVALLEGSQEWTPAYSTALQAWFTDYSTWMTTSVSFGLPERQQVNYHGNGYDAQLAQIYMYLGRCGVPPQTRHKRVCFVYPSFWIGVLFGVAGARPRLSALTNVSYTFRDRSDP